MEIFILYIIGYVLCSLFMHFTGLVDDDCNKKVYIYKLCKYSVFSWFGVILVLACIIVYWCIELDERFTKYLDK